jgi:hypothetical protein
MSKKNSDSNDNVFPEFSAELNLPENIDRRTFLIRNAVIGAAAAMTGTVWTTEAPITALRIRNVRRSMFSGRFSSPENSGNTLSLLSEDFLLMMVCLCDFEVCS